MIRSRTLGLLLVLAVGILPIAPPEHVHQADDHGRAHLLVHRHLAAHSDSDHHGDDGMLDYDGSPVLTLEVLYTVPVAATGVSTSPDATIPFGQPPTCNVAAGVPDSLEQLIHGPPRASTGLRAPPLSVRL